MASTPGRRRRPGGPQAGAHRTRQRRRKRQLGTVRQVKTAGNAGQARDAGAALRNALNALADMGIAVDRDRGVVADVGAVRRQAEQAATSVAAAVGIDIQNADGSLNAAAARRAVSVIVEFDIDASDSPAMAEHKAKAKMAITELSANLGVDVLDSDGQIDATKARHLVNTALDLREPSWLPLTQRDALEALQHKLQTVPGEGLPSRRQASITLARRLSVLSGEDSSLGNGRPVSNATTPSG